MGSDCTTVWPKPYLYVLVDGIAVEWVIPSWIGLAGQGRIHTSRDGWSHSEMASAY